MSRKYCANCRVLHKNGRLGLCDDCYDEMECERATEERRKEDALTAFMLLPVHEKWEAVFNFMYREANNG